MSLDRAERFAQNLEARISLSYAAAKPDLRTRNLEIRVEARPETSLEFRARKLTRRNFSSPADPLARNPEVGSSERGVKTDTCTTAQFGTLQNPLHAWMDVGSRNLRSSGTWACHLARNSDF